METIGQLNLCGTSNFVGPSSSWWLLASICRSSYLLYKTTWKSAVVTAEMVLLWQAGTYCHSPLIPSVTMFHLAERGQGVLHCMCPIYLLGLPQGMCGLSLFHTAWHSSTSLPPLELCHGAEEFPCLGGPPTGVLTTARQYWCKSRADPTAWHLGDRVLPSELSLWSCICCGGCRA